MPYNIHGRDFLTLLDFTPYEITYLLDLADSLKSKKRSGIRGSALAGKNVALIFEKASTRTRCSFIVAAHDEGAHAEYLNADDIQLGSKESVPDSARVISRWFDGIEFRGYKTSVLKEMADYACVPVWNGLTDDFHPTQIMADMMTIREKLGRLAGLKIVYMGDARNNTANSLMIGCSKLGLHYTACAPESLFPEASLVEKCRAIGADEGFGGTVTLCSDPKEAVRGADIIYTDVWYSMGEEDKAEARIKLLRPYQVNMELFTSTGRDDTIFMHDLPAVKEAEVTEEVFEHKRSVVFDEAENRMHTIKAIMVATIGNAPM